MGRVTEGRGKRRKGLFYFLHLVLTFVVSSSSLPPPQEELLSAEIISLEKTPDILLLLQQKPWDFLLEKEGRIFLLVSQDELNFLQSQGVNFWIETYSFPPAQPEKGQTSLASGANGAYHSYQELKSELQELAKKFPSLAKQEEIGRSHEGRSILAIKISDNVLLNEEEPGILFLCCHHAREWISVEVPLLIAPYFLEHYQSNPDIQKIINEAQIWVVPLVNPDGLEYSIRTYRYWRKNRRLNPDGSFGVDLNRNYGFNWGIDNRGSSPQPASEVYRGPSPFSEPETKAIRELFSRFNFQALISYHSYSQVILYPWGFTTAPADKNELLKDLAQKMSDFMFPINGRRYTYGQASSLLYLTNGDTTDWAYGLFGIPAFTIELPPVDLLQGGFFNAEADIQPIFEENLAAALELIRWAINNYQNKVKYDADKEKNFWPKEDRPTVNITTRRRSN